MSTIEYNYVDKDGHQKSIRLENTAAYKFVDSVNRARTDIDNAKRFYQETFYPLWREGYKMYHLSTADRQSRIKKWQQNAAFGMVRSITDVFSSTLTEKPITFNVTGINKKGRENADNIKSALAYSADATGFQEEVKESLKEALKTGTFAADLNYIFSKKNRQYPVYNPEAQNEEESLTMVDFNEDEISDVPQAKHMGVFSFYADPYNGNEPSFVCRRKLMTTKTFEEIFGTMIDSVANKSPLKGIKDVLGKKQNSNGASFLDHETIIDQIHRERATQALARDSYTSVQDGSVNGIVGNILGMSDSRDSEGIIEALLYERDDEIVLYANNYPIVICENSYGFIKAEIQSATQAKRGTDCEGVGYLIGDMERLYNAFGNSHVDNVRQVSDPVFVGIKGSFLDEESIEELEPGTIQWAENKAGAEGLRRLDKGGVSDFGMMEFAWNVATRLTGASEYNFGIASRERTAVGALSVSQSSSRRLSPFMQNFVSFISRIAYKWLLMIKHEWTQKQYVTITDSETGLDISNLDLQGAVIITLQMDSMIAAINEFAYKKLIEIAKQYAGSEIVNEDEIAREIFRSQGLDPSRFVPSTAPKVTVPNPPPPGPAPEPSDFIPTIDEERGMDIQQVVNPQVTG